MAKVFKNVTLCDDLLYLSRCKDVNDVHLNNEEMILDGDLPSINNAEIKEAYQSAFNEGYAEGLAHANQQLAEQITLVKDLIDTIPEAMCNNRNQLSTEVADIVLLVVQQFFINQQINSESITHQINHALAQLNDKQNIELSLHPQDVNLLQEGLLKLDLNQCKGIRIIPDERLRLGGCQIKSEHGLFDAGIERQIDNLKQVLLQIKQGDNSA